MGQEQEDCGSADGGGPNVKWIAGVILCVVGSVLTSLGFVFQTWAQNTNEELVQRGKRPWPKLDGLILSPMWILGFTCVFLFGIPLDMFSLSTVPASVHAPMTGVTVIMGQVLAPWILREPITRLDWMASLLICIGVALTAAFGNHCSIEYSVEDIMKLWSNTPFIVVEVSVPFLLLSAFINIRYLIPQKRAKNKHKHMSVTYALVAGLLGSQQNVFFKSVSELIEKPLFEGDWNDWATSVWPYAFSIGTALIAFFHLSYLNNALKYWTMVKAWPIYASSLMISSVIYGGTFFQDYKQLKLAGFIVYPISLVIQVCGIALLCQRTDSKVREVAMDATCPDDLAELKESQLERTPSKGETVNVSLPFATAEIVGGEHGDYLQSVSGACTDTKENVQLRAAATPAPEIDVQLEEGQENVQLLAAATPAPEIDVKLEEGQENDQLRAAATPAGPEIAPPVTHQSIIGA